MKRAACRRALVAAAACIVLAAAVLAGVPVLAEAEDVAGEAGGPLFTVVVGQSRILQVADVVRVAVADPAVAEVVVVSRTEVLVNGKSEGRTTLHVWDARGHAGYDLRVYKVDSRAEPPSAAPAAADPDVALREAVAAAIGEPGVRVTVVKGTVLLDGQVADEHAKLRAETVARLYASHVESIIKVADAGPAEVPPPPAASGESSEPEPAPEPPLEQVVAEYIGIPTVKVRSVGGKLLLEGSVQSQTDLERAQRIAGMFSAEVVNLIEMDEPLQVLLQVEVVEVNEGELRNIGVTWGGMTGDSTEPGTFVFGEVTGDQEWQLRLPISSLVTEIWRLSPVRAILDLLISEDKARLLAAPSLLTLSGKQASFLVGGEIPVYTGTIEGKVTFEWRSYGVKLNVLPTVDSRGRVVMDVEPEVSSLDWNNALDVGGIVIPALKVRRASTHLVLEDGEGIVLGGLIQESDVEAVKKLPVLGEILGDIPVIGKLFKRTGKEKAKTELVIFITPTIVRGVGGVEWEDVIQPPTSGFGAARGTAPAAPAASGAPVAP